MRFASGHTSVEWPSKKKEAYEKIMTGDAIKNCIYLWPGDCLVTRNYPKFQEKIYNFAYRPSDVVIMTYPKCGTTWMQEIVWTMLNNPNLDNSQSDKPLFIRSPFLESDMLFSGAPDPNDEMVKNMTQMFSKLCPNKNPADGVNLQIAESIPDRRTIKTHLPLSLHNPKLLDTAKVIFVVRNPKDACLSYMHHHKIIKVLNFVGTQDEFVDLFIKGDVVFGAFHATIKEAWNKKDHPNLHFLSYEDLKADTIGELKKINEFIGTELTLKQLQNVKEHSSFDSMKAKDTLIPNKDFFNADVVQKDGGFFNKGVTSGWKAKLTKQQNDKLDAYVKQHLDPIGITFKF